MGISRIIEFGGGVTHSGRRGDIKGFVGIPSRNAEIGIFGVRVHTSAAIRKIAKVENTANLAGAQVSATALPKVSANGVAKAMAKTWPKAFAKF